LQVVIALDRVDVLRFDEVVALDLSGLQRLKPGGVVGDRPEDELLDLRLVTPVVVVADEYEPVAARP
jgi:hypothetical protein